MDIRSEVELRELSVPECFALLATATIGHLAITYMALPLVVPVRIGLAGKELTITSLLGKAVPLTSGSVVALEAGEIGGNLPGDWTVEVRGFLTASNDESALAARIQFPVAGVEFHLSTEEVRGWRPIDAVVDTLVPLASRH
jgi:nitroimidazol reductase NimA-like FMN-containing flavoprotein (pyridoxamine 5'-phosphate oxidase superfamily)